MHIVCLFFLSLSLAWGLASSVTIYLSTFSPFSFVARVAVSPRHRGGDICLLGGLNDCPPPDSAYSFCFSALLLLSTRLCSVNDKVKASLGLPSASWWITNTWPLERYPDETGSDIYIFRVFFFFSFYSVGKQKQYKRSGCWNHCLWVFFFFLLLNGAPTLAVFLWYPIPILPVSEIPLQLKEELLTLFFILKPDDIGTGFVDTASCLGPGN